jgi:hypothetical protein
MVDCGAVTAAAVLPIESLVILTVSRLQKVIDLQINSIQIFLAARLSALPPLEAHSLKGRRIGFPYTACM